jgi:hypothetical protein
VAPLNWPPLLSAQHTRQPLLAMRQMDVQHKKDLEERLASVDVSQKVDEFEYSAAPGRGILFASDEFAAPF